MTQTISTNNLQTLDEQKINLFHLKMVITAGMGFFTDAYDLFIIGIVTAILIPIWHLSPLQIAILNGASLASAALGAIIFGYLADRFGRKKMYGIEMAILFCGAILSALSPSFIWLFISRTIVGFGIGGDYPTSAVVASESANRQNRGFLVLLVFAMQAVGLIVGPSIAALFISLHLPSDTVWRILLGIGAIPAASVFYLRRKISETPRFLATKQTPVESSRVTSELIGYNDKTSQHQVIQQKLFSSKWIKCLIGTAGSWFLLDIAFYGNGVSSMLIMDKVLPHASLLTHTLASALIFLCFAVPGYILSAMYVDKIGRRFLQMLGFSMMGLCYIILAIIPDTRATLPLFIGVFGLSFFFVNFGPNATTFLIPSEIYPTHIRATAHGLSAAIGKVGAFIGAFCLPLVLLHAGMSWTMALVGIVSLLGILTTCLVPEMAGKSLDAPQAGKVSTL